LLGCSLFFFALVDLKHAYLHKKKSQIIIHKILLKPYVALFYEITKKLVIFSDATFY